MRHDFDRNVMIEVLTMKAVGYKCLAITAFVDKNRTLSILARCIVTNGVYESSVG